MSLTILGGNVSPFVRKVRVFCSEKGIPYELEPINPFAAPDDFREVSPLGLIPAMRDGDRVLADSSVICAYLEKTRPDNPLYPEDPYDYGRTLWFEEFIDGGFVARAGPKVFFPLVMIPLMRRQEPDEAEPLRVASEELPRFYEYLEAEIGDNEFFVADRLTLADIAVASPFVNLRHAGVAPERARFPKLRAFLDRMHGRPSFKACIEEESPVFGKRADLVQD